MIREREQIMNRQDFEKREWFPNFIIMCKPMTEVSNEENGSMENEWNGVLKLREMEKVIKSQIEASKQH